MHKFTLIFSLILLAWSAQTLAALGSPPVELLTRQVASVIPPYWTVTDVKVVASANTGNAVKPDIAQRFEATVKAASDLYLKDASATKAFTPYVPVVPTVTAGDTRTLYGVAHSVYAAGHWQMKVILENSVASLGMSRGMFDAPTVVRGSKEATKIQELLRPDIAQRIKRKLQAQIEKIKADNATTKRKLELQRQNLVATDKAAVQRLETAQSADLKQMKSVHQAAVKHLKSQQQAELDGLHEQYASDLALLKQKHQHKLAAIKTGYAQQIKTLKQDIQQTTKLIPLRKKKTDMQTKLAAVRTQAYAAQRNHNKALLATFHKDMAAKDADTRRAAFVAALTSGNALLRQTAIQTALDSGGAVMLNTAIRAGLASDQTELQWTALRMAMKSKDPALRTAAFEAALDSGAPRMQNLALTGVLFSQNVITGVVSAKGDKQLPITLYFKSGSNSKTGKTVFNVAVDVPSCHDNYYGGLAGASMTISGSYCKLRVMWTGLDEMTGTLWVGNKASYPVKLSL